MEVEQLLSKINDLTSQEKAIYKKYREISQELKEIKEQLKQTCTHLKLNSYRYYYSGMHRPEYSYDCAVCKKDLDFGEYCTPSTQDGAKITDHNM